MIPCVRPVVLDVSSVVNPDMSDVDALAALQLLARRLGSSIVLDQVGDDLQVLIEFSGLGGVLPSRSARRRSIRESNGQTEQREQVGVDEEVDPGDAVT
jgi:hypothetical protein